MEWLIFSAIGLTLLVVDLVIVDRNTHKTGFREAIFRTADRIVFIGGRFDGSFVGVAAVICQHMCCRSQTQRSANQARKQCRPANRSRFLHHRKGGAEDAPAGSTGNVLSDWHGQIRFPRFLNFLLWAGY